MSRLAHFASSSGRPNSIQGRNPGTCCTCCVTKHHWEPSACSRTQITRASGQAITYTTPPSTATPGTIMFFTRLTSWESTGKIIARGRNISPLYPLPPCLVLSLFLPSLRNKFKTKVVLSKLKIWDSHHYVQESVLFLQKHSHSLKLQYLFRAHVIFQFTHKQRRAVRFVQGNVVKKLTPKKPDSGYSHSRAHSPTFPSLHLRHSSFSNPSVALPTSQLILQPFRCFTYVITCSPTLLSLLLRHRFFTWRATQLILQPFRHFTYVKTHSPTLPSLYLSHS